MSLYVFYYYNFTREVHAYSFDDAMKELFEEGPVDGIDPDNYDYFEIFE